MYVSIEAIHPYILDGLHRRPSPVSTLNALLDCTFRALYAPRVYLTDRLMLAFLGGRNRHAYCVRILYAPSSDNTHYEFMIEALIQLWTRILHDVCTVTVTCCTNVKLLLPLRVSVLKS